MGLFDLFGAKEQDSLFKQLCSEFPDVSRDAIEMSVTFGRIIGRRNIRQEALLTEFSLTPGRFSILLLLHRQQQKSMAPSELAKALSVSRATMTQFLDSLERELLVERVNDPVDRRAMQIFLTTKGTKLVHEVLKVYLEKLTLLTKALTRSERKQLLMIMEKIESFFPTENDEAEEE